MIMLFCINVEFYLRGIKRDIKKACSMKYSACEGVRAKMVWHTSPSAEEHPCGQFAVELPEEEDVVGHNPQR